MKLIVFGATGMIGQGVLRACLATSDIERVLVIGRTKCGVEHAKITELLLPDLHDYSKVEAELTGYDATLFCLGVSAAGLSEDQYRKITFDLTLAAARALLKVNPQMTFIYISGEGTDSTGAGRTMWARVKGQTENALLALGFRRAYMFRPGIIQPLHGIKSKTRAYRIGYAIAGPLFPILRIASKNLMTDTDRISTALLYVAKEGYSKPILRNSDINAVAAAQIPLPEKQ
jgi:uncharacterized protein YbjT (DUF2867 family)